MIAVDWGSSSLRAYRLDDAGAILDQRRSDRGVLSCHGEFADVLAAQIDGWDDALVMLCGMVGGRGGWREAPYVECPAGAETIAAAIVTLDDASATTAFAGRELRIVPGMIDRGSASVADVMRGEETQIVGLLDTLGSGEHVVCLPGTHSKWVQLRAGAIVSIRTAMTGEAYALFRSHSILAQLMAADEPPFDARAFDVGLQRSGDAHGLLHHLFGVRTAGLLGQLSEAQAPSYLSGLLIGHEIRAQTPRPRRVHLIGSDRLLTAYEHALTAFGIEVRRHAEGLAAWGLYRLGLLSC